MNENLALDLVDALRAADERSAEASKGYIQIPIELWDEILTIYDAILAEEAAQK